MLYIFKNWVPKEALWKVLKKKKEVRIDYIWRMKNIMTRSQLLWESQGKMTKDFPTTIGSCQMSTLSLYLFTLVLNMLTEYILKPMSLCILFVNDIVLSGEALDICVNRSKTKYVKYQFSKRRTKILIWVKIGDDVNNMIP